jgi:predicted amidohydrolase
MVNIGIIQMQSIPLEIDKNLEHADRLIDHVCDNHAELIVLPEFFSVGYSYSSNMMKVAEDRKNGRTVLWLSKRAQEKNIYILTSIYEVENGNYFNTMLLVQPNNKIQYYRKRNPFWQEYTLYQQGTPAGPGIFDTEFGRIGGVICFDAFARESFENLMYNQVDLVAIIACWGYPRLMPGHPELKSARGMLERFSYLATEIVPADYAKSLRVPVIHVGQGGISQSPVPVPKYWPFKAIEHNVGDFWGHSHIMNAEGKKIIEAKAGESEFTTVAPLDIRYTSSRREIERIELMPSYLSRDYYYVQPPSFMAKIMQEWCFRGFRREYNSRRSKFLDNRNS